MLAFKLLSATMAKGHPVKEFSDPRVAAPVWKRIVAIADKYYKPGKFTTFAAYEWTSTPDAKNLHRNIFFRDSKKVPEVPFAPADSVDPRDLWQWMDDQRAAGNEALAVSHNGNLSNGVMFPTEGDHTGRPIDRAWAEARLRNEPLTEIKQLKGQSETTQGLSPNDEFAGYEVFVWQLLVCEFAYDFSVVGASILSCRSNAAGSRLPMGRACRWEPTCRRQLENHPRSPSGY
jgi:hypothetical protein